MQELAKAVENNMGGSSTALAQARLGANGGIDFTREDMVSEVMKTLRKTTCKGCTDTEIGLVLYMCAHYGFDPLMKEIGCIAGQGPWISRDARLRKATEQPDYAGIDSLPVKAEDGKLIAWRCTGYKWRGDQRVPFVTIEHTLDQWRKERWSKGENNEEAMIQKVAEDRCFERMYPISGIRTDTQMGANQERPALQGLEVKVEEATQDGNN